MRGALHGPHGEASVPLGRLIGVSWRTFGEPRGAPAGNGGATRSGGSEEGVLLFAAESWQDHEVVFCNAGATHPRLRLDSTVTYVHKYSHAML
eukprot:1591040-Pyramimonas_sp.AAC.1